MPPGRNDPCPCGSGRKYKQCCAARDARVRPALELLGGRSLEQALRYGLEAARTPVVWEADLSPMPTAIDGDPAARPALLLLAAGDEILHVDMVARAPADAAGVAQRITDGVRAAVARGAALPSLVRVRHAEVAAAVRAAAGVQCEPASTLPIVDEFSAKLRQHVHGADAPMPAISAPDSWAAWELPAGVVKELFVAAAAFHAAGPWRAISDDQALHLAYPDGTRWLAGVMGGAGLSAGLALHADAEDFARLVDFRGPGDAFLAMRGAVLSLLFGPRNELPRAMEREVVRAGWPVDGPDGYPSLWTLNTIGGGISPAQARELAGALAVIPRFVAAHADVLGDSLVAHDAIVWTDAETGIEIRADARLAPPPPVWTVPALLDPGLARGRNADPRAVADAGEDTWVAACAEDGERVARFGAAEQERGASAEQVDRDVFQIGHFVILLHAHVWIALPALTEYDLRRFLYDTFPRNAKNSIDQAWPMVDALRRFVRYLSAHEGIEYPWAAGILEDRVAFERRWSSFPGGSGAPADLADWDDELSVDLDARAMLPAHELSGAGFWWEEMGPVEGSLYEELFRQRLRWRDALIGEGVRDPDRLYEALAVRQEEWEAAPRGGKGTSPSDQVRRERSGRRTRR